MRGFCRLKNLDEVGVSDGFAIHFEEWEWEVGVGLYGFWRFADFQKRCRPATVDPRMV